MTNLDYIGEELTIFAHAVNWKRYFSREMSPFVGDAVLEVGAGLGVNTAILGADRATRWLCLEPDSALKAELDSRLRQNQLPKACEALQGIVQDLPATETFDSILYIDVLEHIEHDRAELQAAAAHLKPGGALIVLSPAHQWLYTPFDKAIGHYRRYTTEDLVALTPSTCRAERICYLDSAGMLLSLANRLLLRQSMPTVAQIKTWDRFVIPASRVLDRLFGYRLGKSVLGVWKKN